MRVLVFLLLMSMSMSSLIHGTHGGVTGVNVGGYQTINNVADPHIQDIAKFAVSKHNSVSKSKGLIFQMFVSGKYQVQVEGTNNIYVLIIEVKDGAAKLSNYEAMVFQSTLKAGNQQLQLKYFKHLRVDIPGGYQPIIKNDLAGQHYQDIAKFAVSKHNNDTTTSNLLIFQKILSGVSQNDPETNYFLVIEAKDGIKLSHYQAKVLQSLEGVLTLNYFQLLIPEIKKKKIKKPVVLSEWKPVENLEKDTHILEIARNAVLEHNKEVAKDDHDVLVFEKVVSGETQEVVQDHEEGVKYRLVISANGAKFEALVWAKVMTSFKPLP